MTGRFVEVALVAVDGSRTIDAAFADLADAARHAFTLADRCSLFHADGTPGSVDIIERGERILSIRITAGRSLYG